MPHVADILKEAWTEEELKSNEHATKPPKISFEYFPPKTAKGIETLYSKVYRMSKQNPLFVDLTWGAGGSTSDLTMQMSTNFKKFIGTEVNMHLTCTNITAESVKQALVDAKNNGITSIVALRGDAPAGTEKWEAVDGGFNCALDLVKFIRSEHGDHFSIAVAGYPEGHPNAITLVEDESKLSASEKGRMVSVPEEDGTTKKYVCTDLDFKKEMTYLKSKVDAGAQAIITQLFYDTEVFFAFVKECREIGIHCPILPGMMPLGSYAGFRRMTKFCRTRVPVHMEKRLAEVADDDAAFKAYGVELLTAISKEVWASGKVLALHFYCLNQYTTVFQIMENLGLKIDPLDTDADKAMMTETLDTIKAELKKQADAASIQG